MNRRELLRKSTALATVFVGGRHHARAGAPYPFTLGVASGEPSANGFVLWTRLAPQPLAPDGEGGVTSPVSVTWEVAADETMRQLVHSGSAETDGRFGIACMSR